MHLLRVVAGVLRNLCDHNSPVIAILLAGARVLYLLDRQFHQLACRERVKVLLELVGLVESEFAVLNCACPLG